MNMNDIRVSIRRYWSLSLVVLLLIPIVMAIYLSRREIVQLPDLYMTSADELIPARDPGAADPEGVPPVLLQGQTELANSAQTRAIAIARAKVAPSDDNDKLVLSGRLSDNQTIMTLSVEAPTAKLAASVLEGYIYAYEIGRRDSVRDAAIDGQGSAVKTIDILNRRVEEVEKYLVTRKLPLLPLVEDGSAISPPSSATPTDILYLYERNALLNERQRRQVDYSRESTAVQIPSKYSVVVQRRSTSRVTPPPPSPVIPLAQILVIGLLLAVALPVARDRLDGSITEARGAPAALRAGVLATFPAVPKRLQQAFAKPGSEWDLAFRSLAATTISTDRLPKAIMVTSPAGTTQDFVAANYAAGLASLGVAVALIGTVPRQDWFLQDVAADQPDADAVLVAAAPGPARVGASPTFPQMLEDAQEGRLAGGLLDRLGRIDRENLYIIPPGEEGTDLSLDGLPPLLEALSQAGIDIAVIAGPGLLTDPSATIMAWSTRHVLWAIELGQVEKSDAHLAADRLELAGVEPFGIALLKRHSLRA